MGPRDRSRLPLRRRRLERVDVMTSAERCPTKTLDSERRTLLRVGTYLLTVVVGFTVLLVSGNYLHEYASGTGMHGWLAWTLVVALEAGGAGGALGCFSGKQAAIVCGRRIALANLGGSVLGNIVGHLLSVGAVHSNTLLVVLTAIVYPAELWAMVHLALVVRTEHHDVATHSVTEPMVVTPASDPTPATQAAERSAPPTPPAPATPEDPPVEGDTTQQPNADDPPKWVATHTANPPRASGSPTQPNPTHGSQPTPQPNEITDEWVARARQFRATRAGQGLGHGGWRALVELGLTQRLAKELAHQLNTEPHLTVVGGNRGTQ